MGINMTEHFSAELSAIAGSVARHDVLVELDSGWVVATTANLSGGLLPQAIATAPGDANTAVPIQQVGILSGVLAAGVTAYATVDANGHIQRTVSPLTTDLIVGRIYANGDFGAQFPGYYLSDVGVTIQDEGTPLATAASTLNFVGAGVAASGTGTTKTITISGGGASTFPLIGDADRAGGGTNNSLILQAAIDAADVAVGLTVNCAAGYFRLGPHATRTGIGVLVDKIMVLTGVGPAGQYGQGTTFCVDAGVTGFEISYPNGANSIFRNCTIEAASRLNTTQTCSFDESAYTITLGAAGDFKNGQVIRMRGAGGAVPMTGTAGSAAMGSATLLLSGYSSNYRGIAVGSYLILGASWPTRTRVLAVNFTGPLATSLTMATTAAASSGANTQISLCHDVIAQIETGGGTTTLTIASQAQDGGGHAPVPYSGTVGVDDLTLEHADTAIYTKTVMSVLYSSLGTSGQGFKGFGIVCRGSTADVPVANCDGVDLNNLYCINNLGAVYAADGDANGVNCHQVRAVQGGRADPSFCFVDGSGLGCTFDLCATDGGYGFLTGASGNCNSNITNSYVEGGSTNVFGPGTTISGGTVNLWEGGCGIGQAAHATKVSFGDAIAGFSMHELFINPVIGYASYYSTFNTANPTTFCRTDYQSALTGYIGYFQGSGVTGTVRFPMLIADHDVGGGDLPGTPWFPSRFRVGGMGSGVTLTLANSRVWTFGSSSPTTTGRIPGDRHYNDFSVGGNNAIDYWRCTVTGAPDTWVAFP